MEINRAKLKECADEFWEEATEGAPPEPDLPQIKDFTHGLVDAVTGHLTDIDVAIEQSADNWKMSRMAVVDRNILRIGAGEILYFDDVPSKVAINEAIELAKKFGDSESPRFVNGILDKIAKDHRPCE